MNLYRVFYNTASARSGLPTMKNISIDIISEKYKEIALVETESLDTLFREMNVVEGDELPVKLKIRSMSVGDIVLNVVTDKASYCAATGWADLDDRTTQLLKDTFV